MAYNGLCMISLRVSATNLVKKTKALIQREDFPKGKSEAMNYTRCWQTFLIHIWH